MGWVSGVAVYIVIWWVVIFMVLPWGVQPIQDEDVAKGHAPSAPLRPLMARKLLVTTAIAAVVWLIVYFTISSGAISFRV